MDVTYADDEQYFQWDNMYVGKHNSEPEKEAMGVQTNNKCDNGIDFGYSLLRLTKLNGYFPGDTNLLPVTQKRHGYSLASPAPPIPIRFPCEICACEVPLAMYSGGFVNVLP